MGSDDSPPFRLALLSMFLKKAGLPDDGTYVEHVIHEDIIVPVIHASNPVSKLTWNQLSDIHTGKITNWKEVGGLDKKIIVVTSHNQSATRLFFREKVMGHKPYKNEIETV